MKRIISLSLIISVLLGFSSCSDYLDMPSKTKVNSGNVFTDLGRAEMAVLACYTGVWMQDAWYKGQAGTDEIYSTESNTNANGKASNYVLDDGSCPAGIYTTSYAAIERCNVCIRGLKAMTVSENDAATRDMLLGECLAIRANCYLNLIRYFGDVPYTTTPVDELSTFSSSRTSRDRIYDAIIADLQEAVKLLPWYSEGKIATPERISKNAAYGILARTALYAAGYSLRWDLSTYAESSLKMARRDDAARVKELYQIADDACKAVINKGENALVANFDDIFRALNEGGRYHPEETMFEVAYYGTTTNARIGYTNGLFIHAKNLLYGKTLPLQLIQPALYFDYEDGDTRRDVTIGNYSVDEDGTDYAVGYSGLNQGKWRCTWKASARTASLQTDVNWPLLRYSDVLLMYAEAENYLNNGPTEAAVNALKAVRTRAFNGDQSKIGTIPSTQDAFFKAVVRERKLELATEGWRRTDLVRWNLLGQTLTDTKNVLQKLASREAPYDKIPTYRAFKIASSTTWKDPLIALQYVDFTTQPTAADLANLEAKYGGKWSWTNMFSTINNQGKSLSALMGQSKILGVAENKGTMPSWINDMFRGYSAGHCELYTLSRTAIIDINPGLEGQQLPGY